MDNHYRVHAYVCGASCVRYSSLEGWATFETILQQRPNDCRYAIVERPVERDFVVWDMFDGATMLRTHLTQVGATLAPPTPLWAATEPNSLVMKAVALYGREHETRQLAG